MGANIDTSYIEFPDGDRGILLTIDGVQVGLDCFWAEVLAYRILYLLQPLKEAQSDAPRES